MRQVAAALLERFAEPPALLIDSFDDADEDDDDVIRGATILVVTFGTLRTPPGGRDIMIPFI